MNINVAFQQSEQQQAATRENQDGPDGNSYHVLRVESTGMQVLKIELKIERIDVIR